MELFFQNFLNQYVNLATPQGLIIIMIISIWSIFWTAIGIWKAARNDERIWFVAILLLNTLGILEIAYLFFFAKEKLTLDKIKANIKSYKINNPLKRD